MAPVHTRWLHAPSPPSAAHKLLTTTLCYILLFIQEGETALHLSIKMGFPAVAAILTRSRNCDVLFDKVSTCIYNVTKYSHAYVY